jgi:hypothetical protein
MIFGISAIVSGLLVGNLGGQCAGTTQNTGVAGTEPSTAEVPPPIVAVLRPAPPNVR